MEESANREIQLATASINNEYQNTQNDELVIEIIEMVERPEIQSSKQYRICKVPHYLPKKWNEEVFTPQVISIGLFHHKNERLKAMEEHKERYFRSFVKRSYHHDQDSVNAHAKQIKTVNSAGKNLNLIKT
ncbi:hypothetical protein CFP56_022391 [Quercus suber]|uniref:Uncharacterized protein n=1 Tax=Quercus suber TaxID=58331 RepID=A0AAW0KB94_QUESU